MIRVCLLMALGTLCTFGSVRAEAQSAQPQLNALKPIAMKGWRYEKGASGFPTFYCDPPVCSSKSMVMYEIRPQKLQMTFDEYRQNAEPITKAMQAGNTHGARFELLSVEDGSKTVGALSLRLFKTRRLLTPVSGPKRVMISGYVFGSRYTVSITSSAESEEVANANFMQFSAPLWLFAEGRLEEQR